MPSIQRGLGPLEIVHPDQQLDVTERRVHATRIVSPNHGLDPGLVQDAFGHLCIRRGPERRDGDQL